MSQIFAIDYGIKRTGIAVTDELQNYIRICVMVPSKARLSTTSRIFFKENACKATIGEPKQMNGKPSESTPFIEKFGEEDFYLFLKNSSYFSVPKIDL